MATKQNENEETTQPDAQEIVETFADVAKRSSKLLAQHIERQMEKGIEPPPEDELGLTQAFVDMTTRLLANPMRLAQAQWSLAWDYIALWQSTMQRLMGLDASPVATPAKDDKRFRDDAWQKYFLFDFIKQSYLITARHIHNTVAGVDGLDEHTRKKVDFFTRQYIDALSPSNFVLTNPEVMRATLNSRGQNLVKGFDNLLRDMEDGNGQLRIRMTDTDAFELGKNVAVTPGKVVYQNDLIQLLQYTPTTEKVYARPLLIVPPWINKYYILDLRDKNSFIKWAVSQGHTVFVISWVNPDESLAEKQFEDYLKEGTLDALDAVCEQTGAKEVNAIGYCLGGTLLSCAAAYLAAKGDKRIASTTFFATLIDFSEPGELGVFIDEAQVAHLERKMSFRGYLEGSEMATTFNMLRANDLIWSFVVNNYLLGKDPFPFDLLYWNSDATRMPAKMHSYYLRNMYMNNLLRVPGGLTLLDTPIDLSKVKTPAYFVSTKEDHIAPWKTTYKGAHVLGGPVRFVLGGSGHIAGIVNPPTANKYGFWVKDDGELPAAADDWLEQATQHEGSWWTDWSAWITALNNKQVPARDPSAGPLPVLDDAPGSYVKLRLDKTTD